MLSILAKTFKTATRGDHWDAPSHWSSRAPRTQRDVRQIELERKRAALRNIGMW